MSATVWYVFWATPQHMPANSGSFRRPWEHSQHPYIFLNEDGMGFTFLGFHIKHFPILQDGREITSRPRLAGNNGEALPQEEIPGVPPLDAKYESGTIYDQTLALSLSNEHQGLNSGETQGIQKARLWRNKMSLSRPPLAE